MANNGQPNNKVAMDETMEYGFFIVNMNELLRTNGIKQILV